MKKSLQYFVDKYGATIVPHEKGSDLEKMWELIEKGKRS